MACIKPLERRVSHDRVYLVPCGWCSACRRDKIDMWSIRTNNELLQNNFKGSYVTFTYDEDHIDNCNGSLDKSVPKLIADRIRSSLFRSGRKDKFKYLIVGEYGEEFVDSIYGVPVGRPHYHAMFFGLDWSEDSEFILNSWDNSPKWNIKILPISPGCAYYVLKYVFKEVHGYELKEVYGSRFLVPPFCHFSKGIGADYYRRNADFIRTHDGCTLVRGKLVPVPPYWLKQLGIYRPSVNLDPNYFEKSFAKYFNSLSIHEKRKMVKFGFYSSDVPNSLLYLKYTCQSNQQSVYDDESRLKLYGRM